MRETPFLAFLAFPTFLASVTRKRAMDSAAARLGRYQLQPTGTNQTIEQSARLIGLKPTAESLTPNFQQRYLFLLVCPNPT